MDLDNGAAGPTEAELAAIEWEWPLIAAEIEVVEAEIGLLTAEHAPTEIDWRRLRRAERRRLRALIELLALVECGQMPPIRREAVA